MLNKELLFCSSKPSKLLLTIKYMSRGELKGNIFIYKDSMDKPPVLFLYATSAEKTTTLPVTPTQTLFNCCYFTQKENPLEVSFSSRGFL